MNRKNTMLAVTTAAVLASPVAQATAAAPKKVVTKKVAVSGTEGFAGRWGYVKVTLVVKKTTTTIGKKKTVKRKIASVRVPEYPDHTDRSVFINQQAIPMLEQEVLRAQFNPNIDMISGATDSSEGFAQSLQAAIIAAKKA